YAHRSGGGRCLKDWNCFEEGGERYSRWQHASARRTCGYSDPLPAGRTAAIVTWTCWSASNAGGASWTMRGWSWRFRSFSVARSRLPARAGSDLATSTGSWRKQFQYEHGPPPINAV